jgi:hypothetical protein
MYSQLGYPLVRIISQELRNFKFRAMNGVPLYLPISMSMSRNRRMSGEELAQEGIYRLGAVGRFENKRSGEPKEIKPNGEVEDPIAGSAMGLFYWEWSVLNGLTVS